MRGAVNKYLIDLYIKGSSITDLSTESGLPRSTLRFALKRAGVLRSRADGVRNAAARGKMTRRGSRQPVGEAGRENMRRAAKARWVGKAVGTRITSTGYVEYTLGPHKGRSVHVVMMEERIGRRLKRGEIVHHIDGNKQNNADNNLAFMTASAHTRLHRREDALTGKFRERNDNGSFR